MKQRKWSLAKSYVRVTNEEGWEELLFVIQERCGSKGGLLPVLYVPFARTNPAKNAGEDWQEDGLKLAKELVIAHNLSVQQ
jgi:hypothetical protein